MEVKRVVSVKFECAYSSYNSLDITDTEGDEVNIRLSDDQYLELHESVSRKVKRIMEDRAEEAKKEEEVKEDD